MPGIIAGLVRWGGPAVLAWVIGDSVKKMGDSAEGTAREAVNLAPWLIGGLAVYAVLKGGK